MTFRFFSSHLSAYILYIDKRPVPGNIKTEKCNKGFANAGGIEHAPRDCRSSVLTTTLSLKLDYVSTSTKLQSVVLHRLTVRILQLQWTVPQMVIMIIYK